MASKRSDLDPQLAEQLEAIYRASTHHEPLVALQLLSTALHHPALAHHPLEQAALFEEVGSVLQRAEQLEAALQLYDDAIARFPHWPFARYERAFILLFLGRTQEGIEDLSAVARVHPGYRDAQRSAALLEASVKGDVPSEQTLQLVLMQHDPQTVLRVPSYLREIGQQHPRLQLARLLLARAWLDRGEESDLPAAVALLEEVVATGEADAVSGAEARFLLAGLFDNPDSSLVERYLAEAAQSFPEGVWGQLASMVLEGNLPPGPVHWHYQPDGRIEVHVGEDEGALDDQ